MHTISRDSPCYLLTSVAKDRLTVFRTDEIKEIACQALDEARKSGTRETLMGRGLVRTLQLRPGRYYHPTRAARAGTPVCSRF